MVANFWLRSKDTSSASNFTGFLQETLSAFGNKKVGSVRLDSGFCQQYSYLPQQKSVENSY
ncbi:MAG: hypothetical protein JSU07_05745 [Bacteroidetes bacterium]|nr:hypothetical protein [Bacteroidota bacterium]